jgi:hypothetical protein
LARSKFPSLDRQARPAPKLKTIGNAVAWLLAARTQQAGRMRRIGVS